jgi:flagellar protein FlaJ
MPKAKKKSRITRFFSAVGSGVFKTGSGAAKAAQHVGRTLAGRRVGEKPDEVARRLQDLKKLELLRKEERGEERKLMEEKVWEEREELKRPLSERLAESFYAPLKRPAQRMLRYFKGLEEDLYKANLKVSPERYVALMLGVSIIIGIVSFVFILLLTQSLLSFILGIIISLFTLWFMRHRPRFRASARVVEVNRNMPYVLRHMATQLSSGIGLPETMTSVSKADYGALSEEFGRVIHDMNAGASVEEALSAVDKRVDSEALRRAVRQIQRTMRLGGDLSRTLGILADETAFELRMKLRDYTQSLNMMSMLYMFAAAVIPAMLVIMMMVAGMMGGAGFTTNTAIILYMLFLPFLLFYFVVMIKRREPKV